MSLGVEVGLCPGDIMLDGDPTPPTDRCTAGPHFSSGIYCGQTAGWIKRPLGMEVGLGAGDNVLDSDPAPPVERCTAPPLSVVTKRSHISAAAELLWIRMS